MYIWSKPTTKSRVCSERNRWFIASFSVNQELPFAQSSVSTDFTDNSESDTSSYQSDSYNVVETSHETPKPSVEVEHENQKDAVI